MGYNYNQGKEIPIPIRKDENLIPKEVRDRIVVTKYRQGASIAEIMAAASVRCPNTLYTVLRAHSIPLRRPRDADSLDALVGPLTHLLFEEGLEPEEAAKQLGQPLPRIMQVIEERL